MVVVTYTCTVLILSLHWHILWASTGQPSLFDSVNSNKTELLGQTRPAWFIQQGQHCLVQHDLAHFCSVSVVLYSSTLVLMHNFSCIKKQSLYLYIQTSINENKIINSEILRHVHVGGLVKPSVLGCIYTNASLIWLLLSYTFFRRLTLVSTISISINKSHKNLCIHDDNGLV